MRSRLRRWDDALLRRSGTAIPVRWHTPGGAAGGLIGVGLGYLVCGSLLLLVTALTGNSLVVPAVFVLLGLVVLPIGLLLGRRAR